MNEENIDYVEFAKNFILKIIGSNDPDPYLVHEILEIKSGNKALLLEHLKAVTGIMNKAMEEIEKGEKNGI